MRIRRKIALLGAVLLPATVVLAPPVQAATGITIINVIQVQLYNHTDPGAAEGYLQAAVDVKYNCGVGTTGATIRAFYDDAQSDGDQPAVCNGTDVTGRFTAAVSPNTDDYNPPQEPTPILPGVATDRVSVGYGYDGGGGAYGDAIAATVAANQTIEDPLTTLFPVHNPVFTKDKHHPSWVHVSYDQPLTTGGAKVNGVQVKYYPDGHVSKRQYVSIGENGSGVVKHVDPNTFYHFAVVDLSDNSQAADTLYYDVHTNQRLHQSVSLSASHSSLSLGHAVTLSGKIKPARADSVQLQKYSSGSWHLAATLSTNARGKFSVTLHPSHVKTYKYRVALVSNRDYFGTTSSKVRIRVHR